MWGNGTQEEECYDGEVFLWQLEGQSELVREDDTTSVLKEDECLLMQPNEKCVKLSLIHHILCINTCM